MAVKYSLGGKLYGSSQWKRLRRLVLSRDPICQVKCCNAMATDVDHIDGDAGNNEMTNLQALCHSCHSEKTVRENRETNPCNKPLKGHDATGLPIAASHSWG